MMNNFMVSPLTRMISDKLNKKVYSLNQISDENCSDFSGCENFVHALQLDEEEEIQLQAIETDISMIIDEEGNESTRTHTQKFELDDSEWSEVEDL